MNKELRFRRTAALIAGAVVVAIALPAVTLAQSSTRVEELADKKAAPLPLTHAFEKGEPGENGGPYALKLTNTSEKALTVNATIVWSVASHNRAKTIKLPPREIAARDSWTISDLAAEDRVILAADGYQQMEITTPPGKK